MRVKEPAEEPDNREPSGQSKLRKDSRPVPRLSRPVERKKTSNCLDKQRHWMFSFMCQASGSLNLNYDDKSNYLLGKTQESSANHLDIMRHAAPPSLNALKDLWISFGKNNQITRVYKTSGRKKEDVRREVEFVSFRNLPVREISQQLSTVGVPISNSSVQRVLKKELKMRFHRSP